MATTLIPTPFLLTDPSMKIFHSFLSSRGFSIDVSSAKIFANACTLIAISGVNTICSSLSLIVHFANLPDVLGLWSVCNSG